MAKTDVRCPPGARPRVRGSQARSAGTRSRPDSAAGAPFIAAVPNDDMWRPSAPPQFDLGSPPKPCPGEGCRAESPFYVTYHAFYPLRAEAGPCGNAGHPNSATVQLLSYCPLQVQKRGNRWLCCCIPRTSRRYFYYVSKMASDECASHVQPRMAKNTAVSMIGGASDRVLEPQAFAKVSQPTRCRTALLFPLHPPSIVCNVSIGQVGRSLLVYLR